jgi:cob(I)alamin adenosyltransferase
MNNNKPGDLGQTKNFSGDAIPKDSKIINAIGNLDELIAHLGLIRYILPDQTNFIEIIQKQLGIIAAEISNFQTNTEHCTVNDLEKEIEVLKAKSPGQTSFYLPGTKEKPIFINIARTVCRRTERSIVNIKPSPIKAIKFLNRLSTYLFALQIYEHYHS